MNYIDLNGVMVTPKTENMAYAQTNHRVGVLEEKHDTDIQEVNESITELGQNFDTQLQNRIQEVSSRIDDELVLINNSISAEIANVGSRVDQIIAHNNDTEGNSELLDIRTDTEGQVYTSAGTSVRQQVSKSIDRMKFDEKIISGDGKLLIGNLESGNLVNGSVIASDRAVHTDYYISSDVYLLYPGTGYKINVVIYNKSGGFISNSGWVQNYDLSNVYAEHPDYQIKVAAARTDNGTISNINDVVIYGAVHPVALKDDNSRMIHAESTVGRNRFNYKTAVMNKLPDASTGELTDNDRYFTSDWIDVSPYPLCYVAASINGRLFFYDSEKNYIGYIDNILFNQQRKIRADASYMRYSGNAQQPSVACKTAALWFSKETITGTPTYDEYGITFSEEVKSQYAVAKNQGEENAGTVMSVNNQGMIIPSDPLTVVFHDDAAIGRNQFNYRTAVINKSLDSSTGELTDNDRYFTSDWIDVSRYHGYYVASSINGRLAFYDSEQTYLGYLDNTLFNQQRKIRADASYMRYSGNAQQPSVACKTAALWFSETAVTSTPTYDEYGITLSEDIKTQYAVAKNQGAENAGKYMSVNDNGIIVPTIAPAANCIVGNVVINANAQNQAISIGQGATTNEKSSAVAIGTNALNALVESSDEYSYGKYNTAIGHQCMMHTTTGDHNTGLGWGCMAGNTTGSGNTALGEDSLCHSETGNNNTCVGNRAYQNGTGSSNVAIGALSMYTSVSPNTPTGDGNVCIGYDGGVVNGSGHHNTCIGCAARSADNINYSCAIGAGARATKSNQVVVGSCGNAAWKPTEILLNGDIVVCDSNNTYRKLVFNQDNSVSWTDVTAQYS